MGPRRTRSARRPCATLFALALALAGFGARADEAPNAAEDPQYLKPLSFVPDPPAAPDLPFPVEPPLVARPLTLPLGILSPSITILADRPGARVLQSANLGFGIAVGAGFNTEVAGSFTAPVEGVTQVRVGFTFQLKNETWFQWGLRPDLGTTHYENDEGDRVTVARPGASLPFVFMLGRFVRLDTGVSANAYLSTRGEYGFAITTRTIDPAIDRPGVPLEITIQLDRSFYFGGETGAGILPYPQLVDRGGFWDGYFTPMGFFMGGTISAANRPYVDVVGSFRFPYFILGERGVGNFNPWQAGVTLRGFVEL